MLHQKRYILFILAYSFRLLAQNGDKSTEVWEINNISSIANYSTDVLGAPCIVETDQGNAVEFNGIDDGLIVDANPVAGAEAFTVEVVFKPYESALASNIEQRFIHMEESDDRRLLIELRLTDNDHWFLDTFIKDGASSKALYAEDFPHPIGNWYHAALVYENGIMKHFVNGQEELSGEVQYTPMQSGQTSIGVRLNQRSWYKGAIRLLKVTHRALSAQEFLIGYASADLEVSGQQGFRLLPNYPNPFNHKTTIHYQLYAMNQVKMTVFDIVGRKISVLIDKYQLAGEYRLMWDASYLASGVYLCQIQAANDFQVIDVILQK